MLFNQIEEFNPDAANGGLQHDDIIDTVAMSMFIVKGRQYKTTDQNEPVDVWDKIKSGSIVDEKTGINYVESLDPSQMTAEQVSELFNARNKPNNQSESRV
jgi:hypothetical protein